MGTTSASTTPKIGKGGSDRWSNVRILLRLAQAEGGTERLTGTGGREGRICTGTALYTLPKRIVGSWWRKKCCRVSNYFLGRSHSHKIINFYFIVQCQNYFCPSCSCKQVFSLIKYDRKRFFFWVSPTCSALPSSIPPL